MKLPEQKMLTKDQRMNAYADVKTHFGLRHWQRTALDRSPLYPYVMSAAHDGNWTIVEQLLGEIAAGTDR